MVDTSGEKMTSATGIDIEAELDKFRKKLLDLTNRNELLNYRKPKARSIQIVDELPAQIYEHLVIQEKSFSFLPKDLGDESPLFSEEKQDGTISDSSPLDYELPLQPEQEKHQAKKHLDDKLQTDLTEEKLDRTLNKMRLKANAAIEETGVNYLYLALGLLKWQDHKPSQKSLLSPLILIPLRIERAFDSRRSKYRMTISYTGEEIQHNICLAKKIELDYGLVLPELNLDDERKSSMPEGYFQEVRKAVRAKPDWEVCREGLVGFFSFRKLLMYLDLDPKNWKGEKSLKNHPLLKAIIEGTKISGSSLTSYGEDYEIDQYALAGKVSLVKDADSSQHSALCDIAEGKSLVIEGPPGTGKSQTITNAIADALGDGKTVLFVAEKLAALEVVRHSLEEVNLGAFCLELHSEAAKPKEVFGNLAKRINAKFPSFDKAASLRKKAEAQKKKLKRYLDACREPVGPHGKPLYDAFWRVVSLRTHGAEELIPATIDTSMNEEDFDEAIAYLNVCADSVKELGNLDDSPWRGFNAIKLRHSGFKAVENIVQRLVELAGLLVERGESLANRFEGESSDWITVAQNAGDDVLEEIAPPALVDESLVDFLSSSHALETAQALVSEVNDLRTARDTAANLVVENLVEAGSAAEGLLSQAAVVSEVLKSSTLDELRIIRSKLQTAIQTLMAFIEVSEQLNQLGFGESTTLRDYDLACHKYQLLSHPVVAPPHAINSALFFADAPKAYFRGSKRCIELQESAARLDEQVNLTKVPVGDSFEELVDVLHTYGSSWTRIFRSSYRKCRKTLRSTQRASVRKLSNQKWSKLLGKIMSHRGDVQDYVDDSELNRFFGDQFLGIYTDWQALSLSLKWVTTAQNVGLSYSQASKLLRDRWEDKNAPPEVVVVNAGKRLRKELEQKELILILGGENDALNVTSIQEIKKTLNQLELSLELIESSSRKFTLGVHQSLSQLFGNAATVIDVLGRTASLKKCKKYSDTFPKHFAGVDTAIEKLSATAGWIGSMFAVSIPSNAVSRIAGDSTGNEAQYLAESLRHLRGNLKQWEQERTCFEEFGEISSTWFRLPGPKKDSCHVGSLRSLQENTFQLQLWAGFCRALDRCNQVGLDDFSQAIYDGRLQASEAAHSFDLTLHEQLANDALEKKTSLKSFSRHAITRARSKFQELDRQLIKAMQADIAFHASRREVPNGVSVGRVGEFTEGGLIRHETGKQRSHCRIRDLIRRAGNAVQALKPCFMMSPLSIAQYLPAGSLEFDLVIMDEASQITPEDALGTLIRAKQLIVVGDPKQLPPTSFFTRAIQDDDGDEETILDGTESILEVALKAFPHRRRLRWHYRSQHESLIAFSNEKFYDDELIVFPSPTSAEGRLGVYYHQVEEASFMGGCNTKEADVIAKAIVRHVVENPNETLGVATFNAKQAEVICDRLDEITANDSEARLAIERFDNHSDKLFVKNLENIQGDERDVIFISYTYGPVSSTNKTVMNRFGPITGEQGWRRLNVLVTRAKRRIELFSSMKPNDIKGGPDRSRGVNAMKDYLQYAMTGEIADRGSFTGREPDSPFEIAVARVIENLGLKAVPQVGVSGYFIDIGILKPDSNGEFLMGIECDGASYHSSKSARDRDRLREEVITSRGWKLHRIWSTDWFMNQAAEEERLQAAISGEINKLR